MNRRKLLTGLGGLTASLSLGLGSGAFTSVSATRSVSIEVADDAYAFLRIDPIVDEGMGEESPATGRSSTNGRTVEFDIPGDDEGENLNSDGLGVDSIYEFHDLARISNQGTQPVQLRSSYDGDMLADLALVNDEGVLQNDPPILDIGDSIDVGLYIDTHGSDTGEFDETLTIITDQSDE